MVKFQERTGNLMALRPEGSDAAAFWHYRHFHSQKTVTVTPFVNLKTVLCLKRKTLLERETLPSKKSEKSQSQVRKRCCSFRVKKGWAERSKISGGKLKKQEKTTGAPSCGHQFRGETDKWSHSTVLPWLEESRAWSQQSGQSKAKWMRSRLL